MITIIITIMKNNKDSKSNYSNSTNNDNNKGVKVGIHLCNSAYNLTCRNIFIL